MRDVFSAGSLQRRTLLGGGLAGMATLLLARHGDARPRQARPWLGVAMRSGPAGGVLVDVVIAKSPAANAGIQEEDILVSADGVDFDRPSDVVRHVGKSQPGDTVSMRIRRGGKERTVAVVIAAHPGKAEVFRMMHVGQQAYDPTGLVAVQGSVPAAMKDLAGEVVLVEFFASWCGNCRRMTPQLRDWHRDFGDKGLHLLGVTSDDVDTAKRIIRDWKIPFTVASDAQGETQKTYRVSAIPAMFLIGRKGVIREAAIGYDPSRRDATEDFIDTLLAEKAP